MAKLPFVPSRLTLGTAQFGLRYGIANRRGLPADSVVSEILNTANSHGVTTFDTARNYGNSEELIGKWLQVAKVTDAHVITKVPALPDASTVVRRAALDTAIEESIIALGREPLDLLLMHRDVDLLDSDIIARLQAAIAAGRISAFGASTYSPAVALRLVAEVPLAALQVPASVVDRRFDEAGVFSAAIAKGILVFVRSVFLQGALLMPEHQLPIHLAPLAPTLPKVRSLASAAGRSLSEFLLVAMRDTPGVTSIVVGVEHRDQLIPHLSAISAPPLSSTSIADIAAKMDTLPQAVLDPSRWPIDKK